MKPADITLRQLGGSRRLKALIGAKDFFSADEGRTLCFKFSMCKEANSVFVTLNGLDLYDVKFVKRGRLNRKTFEMSPHKTTGEFENVPVENLKSVIEDFTGLYLSL